MKKWYLILVIGLISLVLAACGSESAEEVYSNAMDAAEEMESAEATMDMTQNMDLGDEGSIQVDSSYDMEITLDPLAMHMDGTTSMGGGDDDDSALAGLEQDMDMEIYMVDDTIYMYNEMMGGWVKMDGTEMDMVEELAGQQPDPADQIEMFEDYVDDLSFDETDDGYVFKLKAEDGDFDELFDKLIEENLSDDMLGDLGADEQEMLDNMEINSMDMEIGIDKETYDMKTYNVDMDMTMEMAGEKMDISQSVESEYSNINGVDDIEVPDDVEDEAVDQGDMGF